MAPVYDIARNGPSGTHEVDLAGARSSWPRASSPRRWWRPAREHGVLAAALCLRQRPLVTFWRRLTRDLREHRKPPLVLVRRGWALMRDQRRVIADADALGCVGVAARGVARIAALASA